MLKAVKKSLGLSEEERKLEPEGYIVQTSGWPEQLQQRVLEYISDVAQKGVSSVEITLNHPESLTPHAIDEIKIFHEQEDVKVNIHASLDLRAAMAEKKNYDRVDDYMKKFIEKAYEIEADYINLHTSNFPSPELGRTRGVRYEVMVTPEGDPVNDFVEELVNNYFDSETLYWLVKDLRKRTRVIDRWRIKERLLDEDEGYFEEVVTDQEIEEKLEEFKKRKKDHEMKLGREISWDDIEIPRPTRENALDDLREKYEVGVKNIFRRFRDMPEDFKTEVAKKAFREIIEEDEVDIERIFNEFRMYKLIAWRMYERGNSIWRRICGDKSPEEIEEDGKMELLVDAVAGEYLKGHVGNWKDKLEDTDVVITFETPDAREKQFLGYYRLVNPERIYKVVKSIGHPQVKLCFDFEHIATQGLNPRDILEKTESNIGEETYLVHLSSRPSPGHEHFPLQKGEIQLYKMLWELKTKGFESGYLTFERGGGGRGQGDEAFKKSIPIVKEMAMYLEDDVAPGELPVEFYGYNDKAFKRDQAVIQSNTFEPIKGLIESPQMQDTFLGKHATETEPRMRGEGGWEGEEHR
ncbi:MAG: sugar phosphate isomerase/epimerase family protein [Candidatus Aenigmatarchaeota archaeon]